MLRMWELKFKDGTRAWLESLSADGARWQARLLIWNQTGRLIDLSDIDVAPATTPALGD